MSLRYLFGPVNPLAEHVPADERCRVFSAAPDADLAIAACDSWETLLGRLPQPDAFISEARRRGLRVRRVQHDRDSKLSAAFTAQLRQRKVKSRRSSFCAPNMNAYVERFIQTLRKECLDHSVVFGTKHLDYLCCEFAAHHHMDRSPQSLDNEPIVKAPGTDSTKKSIRIGDVRCRQRLGGLLKSYRRKAA